MYKNILGLVVSFIFVGLIIIISTILDKKKIISKEGARKFIHIGVSNWWIIAMFYFNNKLFALVPPIFFIVINYISYKFTIFKAMEREGAKRDLGTIYFPISLLVLVLITFSPGSSPYIGGLGILIMGYGDGLAAVIGKKYGRHKYNIFNNEKSIEGSITMFVISTVVALVILSIFSPEAILIKSLTLGLVAAIIEAISPFGLDNLFVPILTSMLYQFLSI